MEILYLKDWVLGVVLVIESIFLFLVGCICLETVDALFSFQHFHSGSVAL